MGSATDYGTCAGGALMPLKPLDPVLQENLCPGWDITAIESGRSTNGLKANFLLSNGVPKHYRVLDVGDADAQAAFAQICADKTGMDLETVLHTLLQFIIKVESATRVRDTRRNPTPKAQEYEQDGDGLWLVIHGPRGDERRQLTNFGAGIIADVIEDDGTPDTRRFYEVEAHYGGTYATVRVAAKDFHTMSWVPEALGAKAHVLPGAFQKDHAATAIQDLSDSIEHRHTYIHTGWRCLDGAWHYLHGAGAITTDGFSSEVLVSLSETLARYQLPAPPTDQALHTAIQSSLALRDVAPQCVMIPILATAYLAPLRTLLAGEPPDVTTWVVGASGQFKSEYVALALAHYGDFTRLTLPASFTATGNGLERLCHALQDCLLVVDDFYPAGDRRQAEAMNQTAGRLLRGIGNQAGRQRMRQDTSMRSELPPRCLVVATGERLPHGHSTNARIFLVTVPKLKEEERQTWATKLSAAQEKRHVLPQAMAGYLQWIAVHWDELAKDVPAFFHTLRTDAYQAESHAREPSQVAYLQLGWEIFTRFAVKVGALTAEERTAILHKTQEVLLGAAAEHAQGLQDETTVSWFLALLTDGFASKAIYLRTPDDKIPSVPTRWGWTEVLEYDRTLQRTIPVAHERTATLVGYVDEQYLYLLPEAIYQYLQQASQKANRTWPVDNVTLLRELDDVGLIRIKREDNGRIYRQVNKKINGKAVRCIWLKRNTLDIEENTVSEEEPNPHPTLMREPGEEEPDDELPF
jgi:hypothetical protein